MSFPHADNKFILLNCGIITISDTRTFANDKSGQKIEELLTKVGHNIINYHIVKDEPELIREIIDNLVKKEDLHCLILNGGTGISPRDNTYEVLEKLLEKTLAGFGEIFRFLSYQEIGSRAIASRAIAGTYRGKLIFALPGSTGAVKLALEKLIIPELNHLFQLITNH